jgi:hypothetical protein
MNSVSPVEQFFLGEVTPVRRGLAAFGEKRATLTLLLIVLLLTDLSEADRARVLKRLARQLRPRPRYSNGVSPETHNALLATAEAVH